MSASVQNHTNGIRGPLFQGSFKEGSSSSGAKITTIVVAILATLVSFIFLPLQATLIVGGAIALLSLFCNLNFQPATSSPPTMAIPLPVAQPVAPRPVAYTVSTQSPPPYHTHIGVPLVGLTGRRQQEAVGDRHINYHLQVPGAAPIRPLRVVNVAAQTSPLPEHQSVGFAAAGPTSVAQQRRFERVSVGERKIE